MWKIFVDDVKLNRCEDIALICYKLAAIFGINHCISAVVFSPKRVFINIKKLNKEMRLQVCKYGDIDIEIQQWDNGVYHDTVVWWHKHDSMGTLDAVISKADVWFNK